MAAPYGRRVLANASRKHDRVDPVESDTHRRHRRRDPVRVDLQRKLCLLVVGLRDQLAQITTVR